MSRFSTVLLVLLTLVFALACDEGEVVTYRNDTTTLLTVFQNGQRDFEIGPGETRKSTVLEFDGSTQFEARTSAGVTIFEASLTWAELEAQNWTIAI